MKKYVYIRAWCQMQQSFQSFTEAEVARAERDGAPETATYQRADGTWSTFEDIKREDTRREIQAIVKRMEDN